MATGAGPVITPSVICIEPCEFAGEHNLSTLLNEDNWQSWQEDLELTFQVCDLHGYVLGMLQCLDKRLDPIGESNWCYNDGYMKKVIRDHLSDTQKYHTANCETSKDMWSNLVAIHQSCGDQTENQLMRELFAMKAKEGDDIIAHLTSLKQLWVYIMTVCYKNPPFNAEQFKKLLTYTLPASWDDFTRQFSCDPDKKNLDIHIFIEECYEEYRCCQQCEHKEGTVTAYAALKSNLRFLKKKQNLNQIKQHCDHCSRNNHKIKDCYHALKPKCTVRYVNNLVTKRKPATNQKEANATPKIKRQTRRQCDNPQKGDKHCRN